MAEMSDKQYLIEQLMSLEKQRLEATANVHRIEGAQQTARHLLERLDRAERAERDQQECQESIGNMDRIQQEAQSLREKLRSNCGAGAVSEGVED